MIDLIKASICRHGVEAEGLEDALLRYANLLIEENEKYNLTAIVDPQGIAEKHFGDSLEGVRFLADGAKICDVGSGGGLPVIPLALAKKSAKFTAVEAAGKKCAFLSMVSQKLGLGNLEVVNSRIEDFGRGVGREAYDVVTARAVAPLVTLLEYVVPLIKVGGKALIYKGASFEEELADAKKAISLLNIKIERIFDYVLENGEKRVIIEITKVKATDIKYPRPQNRPRLKPLK